MKRYLLASLLAATATTATAADYYVSAGVSYMALEHTADYSVFTDVEEVNDEGEATGEMITVEQSQSDTLEANPSILLLKAGAQLNNFLAIEGRAGFTLSGDGIEFEGDNVQGTNVEVRNILGLFALFRPQMNGPFRPYIGGGPAHVFIPYDNKSGTQRYDNYEWNGFNFAVAAGFDYMFNERISVNLELSHYGIGMEENSNLFEGETQATDELSLTGLTIALTQHY